MNDGELIRSRRMDEGISQFRLARVLGLSSQTLSAWETGKVAPSAGQVKQVLDLLDEIDKMVATGSIARGRRPTPVTARTPKAPGLTTNCCSAPLPPNEIAAPIALSIFSGCGGLALGFAQAGYSVCGFAEAEESARRSFRANFPGARCLAHDVRDLGNAQLDRIAADSSDIDVLIAGPPCQGFSLAGKRDRHDERNNLYREVVRYADAFRPTIVLIENVRLLVSMKFPDGSLVIDHLIDDLDAIGYKATYHELNALDYGVPQFRERLFVIAARADVQAHTSDWHVAPPKTHSTASRSDSLFEGLRLEPALTFRSATSDLVTLESGESDPTDPLHWAVVHPEHVLRWLRDVPEGMSAHDNDDPDLRPPSGYNTTYKRLRWDEPCSTIGTTFGMISGSRNVHPTSTRSLTVREAARCQTFPDDFVFEGSWGQIRTMIGNAVPPRLALAWARHLLRLLA